MSTFIIRIEKKDGKHRVSDFIAKGKSFPTLQKEDEFNQEASALVDNLCLELDGLEENLNTRYRVPCTEDSESNQRKSN